MTAPRPGRSGMTAPRPARITTTYLLLVLVPVGLTLLLLLKAAGPGTGGPPPAAGSAPPVWRLFLALVVVIFGTRVVGHLLSVLFQPRAVGEMAAGIMLGPSVLGALAPEAYHWLFGPQILQYVNILAQIGLALFMFLVGLEFDRSVLGGRGFQTTVVAQVSVAVPLMLGVAVGPALYRDFPPAAASRPIFALFIGVVMSVTAFPVLAQILMQRGLLTTRLGGLAMVCAAIADVVAWLLLTVVAGGAHTGAVLRTLLLTALFAAVMWFVVRPGLAALFGRRRTPGPATALTVLLVGTLLAGVATEMIGIHLIFGAFLLGVVCPRAVPAIESARDKIQDVTTSLLLPAFFAYVGLHTELGLIGRDGRAWLWFAVLLATAVVGKLVATAVSATAVGFDRAMSLRLGVLMNCRGLTELVILSVGLSLGLLSPALFTVLVLVALCATVMTVPGLMLLDHVLPAGPEDEPAAERLAVEPVPEHQR